MLRALGNLKIPVKWMTGWLPQKGSSISILWGNEAREWPERGVPGQEIFRLLHKIAAFVPDPSAICPGTVLPSLHL
jgi:hypothetical protein